MNSFQKTASYILKIIVVLSAIVGIFFSWYGGRNSFMGGSTVFMYFTIQSNIAIALIELIGIMFLPLKRKVSDIWYIIKYIGTVSITLTGFVFCFVLAPTLGVAAWNFQNVLTHVVVPIGTIVDFFVTGIEGNIKFKNVFYVIIPPIMYAIYAGIGYVQKWEFSPGIHYPYFFLNWGSPVGAFGISKEFPFIGCMWWILALLIFLLMVGSVYLLLLKFLKFVSRKK